MASSAAEKRQPHDGLVFIPNIPPENIESHDPGTKCFFLQDDPVSTRMAYHLSSILLSLYGRVPQSLNAAVEVAGVNPVKYDLQNWVQVGLMFQVRNVLKFVCLACPELRGGCLWGIALVNLRLLSRK